MIVNRNRVPASAAISDRGCVYNGGCTRVTRAHDYQRVVYSNTYACRRRRVSRAPRGESVSAGDSASRAKDKARTARQADALRPDQAPRHAHRRPGRPLLTNRLQTLGAPASRAEKAGAAVKKIPPTGNPPNDVQDVH